MLVPRSARIDHERERCGLMEHAAADGGAVTDLPTPPAPRLTRPSWRDTRLVIGLLIVLGSVALGARVVAAADRTVPVYAAATTLVAGHSLREGDLVVIRVRLGSGAAPYLSAAARAPEGATVLRTIGSGELVPRSAVGPGTAMRVRPVTVPLETTPPTGLSPGARVDVWSSARDPASGATAYLPPQQLAVGAEVYAVNSPHSGLSGGQGGSVQVLLEESALRAVLDAIANGGRLALVPAPGSAPPPSAG